MNNTKATKTTKSAKKDSKPMKKQATNSIAIATTYVENAIAVIRPKTPPSVKENASTVDVPLTDANKDLLGYLADNFPLSQPQINKINKLFGLDKSLTNLTYSNVETLYRALSICNTSEQPILEHKLGNRWYPVKVSVSKFRVIMGWMMEVNINASLGQERYNRRAWLGSWSFEDNAGKTVKKSIDEILKTNDLRLTTDANIQENQELCAKMMKMETQEGKMHDAIGEGLVFNQWWYRWEHQHLGSVKSPVQVIVEPTLELPQPDYYDRDENGTRLPFLRIFSLKHKNYQYIDVRDVQTHIYARGNKSKIILPDNIMKALNSIFEAPTEAIFGDSFSGRHGGLVVMANGSSGIGKTLSAEVFAEHQERPLYCMEMGEIGTNLQAVEQNLNRIFARAHKWNCCLLFDEADIFLSERVSSDLERSSIVGVFLRLMDYFEGTFFLTTNRGHAIDPAFKSRVTLYLNYPELNSETRTKIWNNMLSAAELTVQEDGLTTWEQIAELPLNGRQIRNQIRLLKLMFLDGKLTTTDIFDAQEFAAK
jgi:hypothetical protein